MKTPAPSGRPLRNKEQTMGVSLTEWLLGKPDMFDTIDRVTREIAEAGYGIVRLNMISRSNFHHRHPTVIAAVKRFAEQGHLHGMRVNLLCEPHERPVMLDMGKEDPGVTAFKTYRVSAQLVDGNFALHCPSPDREGGIYEGIFAAYLRRGGKVECLREFRFAPSVEYERYSVGYTQAEQPFVLGRLDEPHRITCHLTGKLPGVVGELIVYPRFKIISLPDFSAPGFHKYFRTLIECYRDVPLDGFGWDEPAAGGDWGSYRMGDHFLHEFAEDYGYDLADRFYLMDECGIDGDEIKVRTDYYHALNESLFRAQRKMIEVQNEFFGPDLILGSHHTWTGEGGINDYRAGAVDYFRLNENMDAGYTDCWAQDWPSVCWMYSFGSSLGRLTPTGETEINSLYEKVTNSVAKFQARFLTLFNINWFNGFYGEANDHKYYPGHRTWRVTAEATRKHRANLLLLGDATPATDIAIWHGWEGVTAINRPDYACAHKTFCINTSTLLTERNIAFDWIDSGLLGNASIDGAWINTALGRYRTIVLPYANTMRPSAWKKIVDFARSGGRLIFVGPPPDRDTDTRLVAGEFAALLEAQPPSLASYMDWIGGAYTLPHFRAQRLYVTYPLTGPAGQLIISEEDEPHALRSTNGRVVYLTDLDPRERLLPFLTAAGPSPENPPLRVHSDALFARPYKRERDHVLVMVAREKRKLEGVVEFGGHRFKLTDGEVAFAFLSSASLDIQGEGVAWEILRT